MVGLTLAAASIATYGLCTTEFKVFHHVVLCLWIIAPPLWFLIETLYLAEDRHDSNMVQTQELMSKLWVAVSVLLGLFEKGFRP